MPAQTGPDLEEKLASLAVQVALLAPMRQGEHVVNASIPWSTIHAIRSTLSAYGVDWVEMHKKVTR